MPGYVPTTYSQSLNTGEINIIPPYPDAGVMYARYSKTQIGQNTYRINPQNPVAATAQIPNGFSIADLYTVPGGKTFYMTDLVIQKETDASTNSLFLSDGPLGGVTSVLQHYTLDDAQRESSLHFEVPLIFKVSARFSLLINASDVRLNCVGWIEDN